VNDQEENPFDCRHGQTEVRRRTQTNGVQVAVRQCLRCGSNCGAVSKAGVFQLAGKFYSQLAEWDQALLDQWSQKRQQWWKERWEAKQREYHEEQDERDAKFWEEYEAHLASDKWKAIRRKVLARCRSVCEGCGERPAVHVHHLTYKRLGREMLFDLAGVCKQCHEAIHGRPLGDTPICKVVTGGRS
jgi:predicted HNH restriction endonuclease